MRYIYPLSFGLLANETFCSVQVNNSVGYELSLVGQTRSRVCCHQTEPSAGRLVGSLGEKLSGTLDTFVVLLCIYEHFEVL